MLIAASEYQIQVGKKKETKRPLLTLLDAVPVMD